LIEQSINMNIDRTLSANIHRQQTSVPFVSNDVSLNATSSGTIESEWTTKKTSCTSHDQLDTSFNSRIPMNNKIKSFRIDQNLLQLPKRKMFNQNRRPWNGIAAR
jgi:hypothetical protein